MPLSSIVVADSGRRNFFLLLFLCYIISISTTTLASSSDEKLIEQISTSSYWMRLLHYRKGLVHFRSDLDGQGFFFAKEGKHDPKRELVETLKAFEKGIDHIGVLKQHVQCAFPERYRYLKSVFHLTTPNVECHDFSSWKKGIGAKKISIVFASAYPNNPASVLGHTFFKLHAERGSELLDYGLNYAATTGSDGGVTFALFGVFGGYEGHFSIAPYYIKVNEYNNAESRDLWEYELRLSEEQIDRMLGHIWELESTTYSKYFFFDENCSYQLLALLEVADPSLELTGKFPVYVIPGDTVRVIEEAGLIKSVKWRPSLKRQYQHAESDLDKKINYLRYKKHKHKGYLNLADENQYASFLNERSKMPQTSTLLNSDEMLRNENKNMLSNPLAGHASSALNLGWGKDEVSHYGSLGLRAAFHDITDFDAGHDPYSRLEVLGGELRTHSANNKVSIQKFTFLDTMSLFPYDGFELAPSWRVALLYEDPFWRFFGGVGLAQSWKKGNVLAYVLPQVEMNKSYRKIFPELGVVTTFSRNKIIAKMISSDFYLQHVYQISLKLNSLLQIKEKSRGDDRYEYSLALRYYY